MNKTTLITGVSGFVGQHLYKHLLSRNEHKLWGVTRRHVRKPNHEHSPLQWVEGPLTNTDFWISTFETVKPDIIYHLAGQAQVKLSWDDPVGTFTSNVLVQMHMMEALRKSSIKPVILIVGSSEQYGQVQSTDLPIKEETQLHPLSPYAVSKVAQDLMAYQYFRAYGLRIIRTRAFNHTGPGRSDSYAVSGFCKQIASIEAGLSEPVVRVGNLKAQRDYLDVRDVVEAYRLAAELGLPGEVYNICSGTPVSLESILQKLLSLCSKSVRVEQDPERLRPSDLPIIYGDSSKFRKQTGWTPRFSLDTTLHDLLAYWRQELKVATPHH